MPNRILALDVQGSRLVALVVESSFRSYEVVGHVHEPRDAEMPLRDQLRRFVESNDLRGDSIVSVLPGNAAVFRFLDLPFSDRRRLQQTIPFELESHVPLAVDDGVIDFHILRKDGSGARVFAALTPSEQLEEHLGLLAEVGVDPAVVDFAPLTALNVVNLFEGQRPAEYAFLHVDGGQGCFGLWGDGELRALRVLDAGGPDDSAELLREIRWAYRSLRNGDGTEDRGPLPCLVGGPLPEGLPARLEKDLGVAVQRLEDLPLEHVPDAVRNEQGIYAAALGAALRDVAELEPIGLNFRQGEFAYHRVQQELRDRIQRIGVLAAIVLVLFFASQAVSLWSLSSRHAALEETVETTFREILPDQPVIEPVSQLTQAIDSLERRQEQLGVPGGGAVSPLDVLREVSARVPKTPRMNVEEFTSDRTTARLRGSTSSFEAVEAIKQSLLGSTLLRDVQVKDPRTTSGGEVSFRLHLVFGREGEAP